jgi:transcriptional regulator with XRE-family HTH domain
MSEQGAPDVGAQVRALRQQRGLSLRTLAELCDLSPNTISLIERGTTSPSVSTLHRLATALSVPITAFFEGQAELVQVVLTRAAERSRSGSATVRLESLGSGLEEQSLEPFLVTMKPGADSGQQMMVHTGQEMVYCLQGEVE